MSTTRAGYRNWLEALRFALTTLWREPGAPGVEWGLCPGLDDTGGEGDGHEEDGGFPGWDAMILSLLA